MGGGGSAPLAPRGCATGFGPRFYFQPTNQMLQVTRALRWLSDVKSTEAGIGVERPTA